VTPAFSATARTAATPLLGRCTFPPASSEIACAVSGGADSLALLLLAWAAGCQVVAHHVDHGLRAGSDLDAAAVQQVAALIGVAVVVHRADLEPGPNLEARARAARRSLLPVGAATGHTADDQAETVLLNLMRGASTDGLAAMRSGPGHPLLGLRRAETRALCAGLGLEVVDDPSNLDPVHLRNRVRHELLPLLCELSGRDVVPILARQALLLADDAALLTELAAGIDPTDVRALAGAPVPLARRAVRRWLRTARPALGYEPASGYAPSAAVVERVLAVAAGTDRATEIGSGQRVRRSGGRLFLEASRADS